MKRALVVREGFGERVGQGGRGMKGGGGGGGGE